MRRTALLIVVLFGAFAVHAAPVQVVVLKLGSLNSGREYTVPDGKVLIVQRIAASGLSESFKTEVYLSMKAYEYDQISLAVLQGKGTAGFNPSIKIPSGGIVWSRATGGHTYVFGFLVDASDRAALSSL